MKSCGTCNHWMTYLSPETGHLLEKGVCTFPIPPHLPFFASGSIFTRGTDGRNCEAWEVAPTPEVPSAQNYEATSTTGFSRKAISGVMTVERIRSPRLTSGKKSV
jgi:hypothetical protein